MQLIMFRNRKYNCVNFKKKSLEEPIKLLKYKKKKIIFIHQRFKKLIYVCMFAEQQYGITAENGWRAVTIFSPFHN